LDTTVPSRVLRRLGRAAASAAAGVSSAIGHSFSGVTGCRLGFELLGCLDLLGPQQGLDARDLPAQHPQAGVVVQLAGDVLEAQVEQLVLDLHQPGGQLVGGEGPELLGTLVGHQTSTSSCCSRRSTNLALMGSFWMARSMA